MDEEQPTKRRYRLADRLNRTRLVTGATMVLERGWPLLIPVIAAFALFATVSWFGLFRYMPDTARLVVLALFGLAVVATFYPLRFFRAPSRDEIDRRIEHANALMHTPLRAQSDRPVGNEGSFALALWREHQRRMAAKLAGVGSDLPRTGVPGRDPWALRAAVALVAVVAFAFSFGSLGGSIEDGFQAVALPAPLPPRIDAWVTPPAYTGKAPVFLTASNNAANPVFTVPAGSDVALRVTGGSGEETLVFKDANGSTRDLTAAESAKVEPAAASAVRLESRQFGGKLVADGVLALSSRERELAHWAFTVIADRPPTIEFTEEPKRAANGALELHYRIDDDYGAASAKADIVLEAPPGADARPLYGPPEMPLGAPRRGSKDASLKAGRDLTEHVWSGSRILLTLSTVDDAGQEAKSQVKTIVLPERPFANPLARAVVELRKILALDANSKKHVIDLIDAVTLRPEDTIPNASHYLGLMAGRARLVLAGTDDQLRDVADYLWNMALQIENGSLTDAERRLKQAQEALRQALRDGASDEQLDRLMKELREATNAFLREFAEKAARNPNMAQQPPRPGQEISRNDLEKMMDEIEKMAKSGNRQQAEEMLSQLQDMMNNLQAQRQPQPGEDGQQSEMRQQMNKLGEIMRRQQETMNETYRMDQMQRGQQGQDPQRGDMGEQGQSGDQDRQEQPEQGQEGQPGKGMSPKEFADALKQLQDSQGKLQGDLDALMKGLKGMGIQPGEGFGEADDAMGKAEGALGKQEGGRAVGQQGRALEALRKGGQDMMKQMQQAMQGDQGGSEEGGRQQNADRDPLGRPRATSGPDFGDSVKVPDEIDVQRARQILEAIRKRLGNALSPDLERSYLERLLEMR